MFALVDCNNFFASCERAFDPALRDKPVVVLSNNDGCVISRTQEAKDFGIKMGVPWFKVREEAERQGVIARSSNYALYADMSNRAVEVLRGLSPRLQVYSIDESFLDFTGIPDRVGHGRLVRQRVGQWVGLPVCVGIAPTKTLAKLANHIAKTDPAFEGVCDLAAMPPETATRLFEQMAAREVWGVGRKLAVKLQALGIRSVADLRAADPRAMRKHFSVVAERMVQELQGISCLELSEVADGRQQIICSRSFGRPVTTYVEMAQAVSSYVTRAAEKLRSDGNRTRALTIWIESNFYNPELPQNSQSYTIAFPEPSDDTRQLVRVGLWMLKRIYRSGIRYRKAGCVLTDITPSAGMQCSLFSPGESSKVTAAMDRINARFGRGTVKTAAEGYNTEWYMKREKISPQYTTDWNSVMVVR